MPTESEIISLIRRRVRTSGDVLTGIGDDAAVIKGSADKDLLACCDLMVEGVHFQIDWTPPRLLGRKALAINLSDIAAMGGVSKFAMISVALPDRCSEEFIVEFFEGVFEMAEEQGVSIIGGDTSSSREWMFVDISLIGECGAGCAVTRAGAKPGDVIYVSGSLGGSALGLKLLGDGVRLSELGEADDDRRTALLKHLSPQPQTTLGRAIGEARLATAMIDISDGLSTDLWHILEESNCGAIIHADAIPISASVRGLMSAAESTPRKPVACDTSLGLALSGGEEYELLFTANPASSIQIDELKNSLGLAITAIGQIDEGEGLRLEQEGRLSPLAPSGYEHLI
jgi:thiamine-monophosphate kinase